jgi:cob(I)alamin adenosyltransferase
MGHRLTKVVTRTGDDGTTGLGDGRRVGKDSARVRALGELDELNSTLGCVLAEELPEIVRQALSWVQNDLFDLGGEVAIPGRTAMTEVHVARIDGFIATMNEDLPPLREFVLPGGERPAAMCHLARATCRRAERALVALAGTSNETVPLPSMQYMNRLSDLLFVAARTINRAAGHAEDQWQPGRGTAQ